VIDGEIVCLDARGRSNFKSLFRLEWPYFDAFDLLAVDGEDLREWPLVERKRRLRPLLPSVPRRLLYVDHVEARERDFSTSRVRTTLSGSWASSRAVVIMPTARAPTGARSRILRDAVDRSPRTLRAPNRFAQAPSDAARAVIAQRLPLTVRPARTIGPPDRLWRSGRAHRDVCPQYFSIQSTTSLIIWLRGIECDVS
jgi:hypothetical protein